MSHSSQSRSFIDASNNAVLEKNKIQTLQINLGRKCNLACAHCHVEAGPHRTEELSTSVIEDIITIIKTFPQIKTVDLTGGAPEMNAGFRQIVEAARKQDIDVIVRSNLTIFFVDGYGDLPEYFRQQKVKVVASLPCYTQDNVDQMRGNGVFQESIQAIKMLNAVGYGKKLSLDLVYNPAIPKTEKDFCLAPDQKKLEQEYKKFLGDNFDITFNNLIAITNLPVGRYQKYLERKELEEEYIEFLAESFNYATLPGLMCKTQWSVDYDGYMYDCDFHQIEKVHATDKNGKKITLKDCLEKQSLDIGGNIPVRNFCLGCTAGAGASCGGTIV